jgi:hypothetical protein
MLRSSGAEGARTPDLLAASQTLSQLSYSPVEPAMLIHAAAAPWVVGVRADDLADDGSWTWSWRWG